eukprot:13549329-Alexandrium_andersonii.AAC.1
MCPPTCPAGPPIAAVDPSLIPPDPRSRSRSDLWSAEPDAVHFAPRSGTSDCSDGAPSGSVPCERG